MLVHRKDMTFTNISQAFKPKTLNINALLTFAH